MSYQEPQMYQQIQELEDGGGSDHHQQPPSHRLAMLHLSPPPTTTTTTTRRRPTKFEKCSQCGTLKKRSPLSSKTATLNAATTTTTAASDDVCNHQNSKTTTTTFDISSQPFLQRSLSEPIYLEETQNTCTNQYLNTLSPETSKTGTNSPSPSPAMTSSLPPLPPPLRRTLSEPTSADPRMIVAATTPPPPPPQATRTAKRSPVSEESPDSKRLKRMKERMKEMSEWCGQVMNEDDEDLSSEDFNSACNPKDECDDEHEEAVWVEKQGEGLMIHFKCPCGKGYGIFLYGNNCYYKLM